MLIEINVHGGRKGKLDIVCFPDKIGNYVFHNRIFFYPQNTMFQLSGIFTLFETPEPKNDVMVIPYSFQKRLNNFTIVT